MKKILCLIDGLHQGGAERQMIGLTYLLYLNGFQIELLSYNGQGFYSEMVEQYGFKSTTLDLKGSKFSKFISIWKYLEQKGMPDVIIAFKDSPAVIACLLNIFKGGFKLIVSERNTTQVLTWSSRLKFFLYRWADAIVPNSFSQGNFIIKHFPSLASKVNVITNFTDTNHFTPAYQSSHDIVRIVTAARISRQKNLINYLNAVKILKEQNVNVHFDWFGTIQTRQEDYGHEVMNYYHEHQLEDIITFHPATYNIINEYQNCDAFCLPSSYEGFPNVVCEAMSCGKPILCSRVCDNPNIVIDGENGFLFDPKNPTDMAEKISLFCGLTRNQRMEICEKNRERALELFSHDAFIKKYIDLIECI